MIIISVEIFMYTILYGLIPLWLENHTLAIHLQEIYCTFGVGKSSLKLSNLSNEFHEDLVLFHTPEFISLGIFMYTILYGFIPLQLENHMIYHTPMAGKLYDISYPYGWKII
jgi:hypothetical protein